MNETVAHHSPLSAWSRRGGSALLAAGTPASGAPLNQMKPRQADRPNFFCNRAFQALNQHRRSIWPMMSSQLPT